MVGVLISIWSVAHGRWSVVCGGWSVGGSFVLRRHSYVVLFYTNQNEYLSLKLLHLLHPKLF